MKKNNAFTVIELLVVISIIGLLASIVLVSINISKENVRITVLKEFGASIYHALGSNIAAYWNFDGTLNDISGNNHNLTDPTGLAQYSSDSISGKSLFSDATGGFQYTGESIQFNSGSFTGEFWIKVPISLPNTHAGAVPIEVNSGGVVGGQGTTAFFSYGRNDNGIWYHAYVGLGLGGVDFSICTFDGTLTQLLLGRWNYFVLSYDPNNTGLNLYLNGKIVWGVHCTQKMFVPIGNSATIIGVPDSAGTGTYIDDVRLYDAPLSLAEIEQHYANGLYKIQLAELTENLLLR